MRWAVAVVALFLLVPVAQGAPFLQSGVDAGNTAMTTDPGPTFLDLAIRAPAGGVPTVATPVIVGDSVFALYLDQDADPAEPANVFEELQKAVQARPATLWQVSLDSGTSEPVFRGGVRNHFGCLASDGSQLFVGLADGLHALDFNGQLRWSAIPRADEECVAIRVANGVVYTGWRDGEQRWSIEATRADGSLAWTMDGDDVAPRFLDRTLPTAYQPTLAVGDIAIGPTESGLGAIRLAPNGLGLSNGAGGRAWLGIFHVENGTLQRTHTLGPGAFFGLDPASELPRMARQSWYDDSGIAIVGPMLVFKDDTIGEIELATGRLDYFVPLAGGRTDAGEAFSRAIGPPLAVDAGSVLGWDAGRLVIVDRNAKNVATEIELPTPEAQGFNGVLLATPRQVLIRVGIIEDVYILDRHDLTTAARLNSNVVGKVGGLGVGEGVLALLVPGEVRVYGVLPIGIQFGWTVTDPMPGVEQDVVVDLGRSSPGLAGGPLEFQVDWGDGTITPWSEDRVHEHAYSEEGDRTAILRVRSGDQQNAERQVTFHVGQTPPTFLQTAFSPDNQESTFFLLGVILTLIFAGFGVVRLRRKRYRLRKELAAADAFAREHRDAPDAMREALREHRLRARRLFLEGRLDEGSTGILERHIDELLRDHRLHRVEAELGFLPHELFRAMQEMLRDARVTQMERNQFLRSLNAEKILSAAQKRRVQRHVEAWHREDAV